VGRPLIALFLVLFTLDFWIVGRRPHVPKTPELLRWLGPVRRFSAILFGLFLGWQFGGDIAVQFYSGWLTEYSLSVDNLFVFVLIMARFYVPARVAAVRAHVGHHRRADPARDLHRARRRDPGAVLVGLLPFRNLPDRHSGEAG
jgi:hypothetical protein